MRRIAFCAAACAGLAGQSFGLDWQKATVVDWTARTGITILDERIPFFDAARKDGGPLHLVWQESWTDCTDTSCRWQLWYTRQEPSCLGIDWGEPELLYDRELPIGVMTMMRPQMAVSPEGCVGIVFWDQGETTNRVLRYLGLPCASVPEPILEAVPDSGQLHSGRPNSILFDEDGGVHITFFRRVPDELRYLQRSPEGIWSSQLVRQAFNPRYPLSLTLDTEGNPVMAYHNAGPITTDISRLSGGIWSSEMVGSGGDYSVDMVASPVTGDETVCYSSALWWTDLEAHLACRVDGVLYLVDMISGQDVGRFVSVALDEGTKNPRVAHYDKTNRHLKFARFGAFGTTGVGWQAETVLGSPANEAEEEGMDVGRLPILTRAEGSAIEIVYLMAPATLFGGSTTIKVAGSPTLLESSTFCPAGGPVCSFAEFGTGCPDFSVAVSPLAGNRELLPCLDCPDIFPSEICQYIQCDSNSLSPVCEACLAGTFGQEQKGFALEDALSLAEDEEQWHLILDNGSWYDAAAQGPLSMDPTLWHLMKGGETGLILKGPHVP